MRVAIMQPYLFPYLGYFQLIRAADKFVLHDDVQFIKGGWVNRNRMLFKGQPRPFVLPVSKGPSTACIDQRRYADSFAADKAKISRQLQHSYSRAPYYGFVMKLVDACFSIEKPNVARFNTELVRRVAAYLGIVTPISVSSEMELGPGERGVERVLKINRVLQSTHYINPIGGVDLYRREEFAVHDLELSFLQFKALPYQQFAHDFVPDLSILDVLMFNPPEQFPELLRSYRLLT